MEKPNTFKNAVKLVYFSLIVGLIKATLYEFLTPTKMLSNPTMLTVGVLTLVIIGFLGYMAGEAKNWARITFLVMFILGSFMMPSIIMEEFRTVPIIGITTLLQTALQLFALIILFNKESRNWFKHLKTQNVDQEA
jgi:hypothetical protein